MLPSETHATHAHSAYNVHPSKNYDMTIQSANDTKLEAALALYGQLQPCMGSSSPVWAVAALYGQ